MITQDQFNYVIKNLSERGLIEKCSGGWLFTEKGEKYTRSRSGTSWIRISCYSTDLWAPDLLHIDEPMYKWDWWFMELYQISEKSYMALCEYFEIPLEQDNANISVDDIIF